MNRKNLLEKLDKATDRAAYMAVERAYPIQKDNASSFVGTTVIKKNNKGFYDIFIATGKLLYADIIVFDIATIISQKYTSGELKAIDKVLVLEQEYAKHRTNMMHYLHCIAAAKKRHDYDAMAILEDKFQMSETRARRTRDNISIYKRHK